MLELTTNKTAWLTLYQEVIKENYQFASPFVEAVNS
jgi:hypothetical protein